MPTKAQLRELCLARRARLTPSDRCRMSADIAIHVSAMPAFQDSRTIMLYLALPQEVQTEALLAECHRKTKRIAVPVVTRHGLLAAQLQSEAKLRPGSFGILEPAAGRTIIAPDEIDCVLVPGIAFDGRGARLGFGKGYYDRFLCRLPAATHVCGLAFSSQIIERVPDMPHDVRMHWLVTEQGVRNCADNI